MNEALELPEVPSPTLYVAVRDTAGNVYAFHETILDLEESLAHYDIGVAAVLPGRYIQAAASAIVTRLEK